MRHSLWLYRRRDGGHTLHWKPGCPLGLHGHRDRLVEFDGDWQRERGWLDDESPAAVTLSVAETWGALVCVHCFPEPVLNALGIEHDPRRLPGVPLRVA